MLPGYSRLRMYLLVLEGLTKFSDGKRNSQIIVAWSRKESVRPQPTQKSNFHHYVVHIHTLSLKVVTPWYWVEETLLWHVYILDIAVAFLLHENTCCNPNTFCPLIEWGHNAPPPAGEWAPTDETHIHLPRTKDCQLAKHFQMLRSGKWTQEDSKRTNQPLPGTLNSVDHY